METFGEFLNNDHHRYEQVYLDTERCVSRESWDDADVFFQQFNDALNRHFALEEQFLFAEFEKVISDGDGPTSAMRREHQKILCVVAMLADALKRRARNAFLGHSDTLRIMMGQHHELEENVVFPIIDRALSRRRQDILKAMHEYCDKSALAQQEN